MFERCSTGVLKVFLSDSFDNQKRHGIPCHRDWNCKLASDLGTCVTSAVPLLESETVGEWKWQQLLGQSGCSMTFLLLTPCLVKEFCILCVSFTYCLEPAGDSHFLFPIIRTHRGYH